MRYVRTACVLLFMVLVIGAATDGSLAEQAYVTISAIQAKQMLDSDHTIFLLDVRSPMEYMGEHIAGAVNIQHDMIVDNLDKLPSNLNTGIIVYCQSGSRSAPAANTLDQKGFTNVSEMTGGLNAWIAKGFPTASGPNPYPTTTITLSTVPSVTSPESNSTGWSSVASTLSSGTCTYNSTCAGNTSQGSTTETSLNARTSWAPFALLMSALGLVAFFRRLKKS